MAELFEDVTGALAQKADSQTVYIGNKTIEIEKVTSTYPGAQDVLDSSGEIRTLESVKESSLRSSDPNRVAVRDVLA